MLLLKGNMKYLSIFILLVFVNFMALPSLATIFQWEIPSTNLVISEEESPHAPLVINEKSLPKTLSISDYQPYFQDEFTKRAFQHVDDSSNKSPHLSIFSPPPEV